MRDIKSENRERRNSDKGTLIALGSRDSIAHQVATSIKTISSGYTAVNITRTTAESN
ncbi:hypothetical protein DPMN_175392 [Dreissena polymorpha]|uniref:Uncharacterized protein n=1 Tax=Dreissena polymorpha TaxID=45954 RepID=A0A9D4IG03_DREPO|nr:hypothetical protein DPMN_175392 [Dreissena polymorpha]